MPVLNDNKCYAEPPKRPAVIVPEDLRSDWFADFHERLAKQLKLNNIEKDSFINEFNRHAGSKSTYSLKSQLLDSLRKLYCIYTHPKTNTDQQFLIASGIREDITECSPGFTDRVNFLLTLFDMPQNLDELMVKARFDLVDKIARAFAQKNPQGVHVHSRFFVIAERFGYGVSAINEEDLYLHTGSSGQSNEDIEKVLAEGFKHRFGLFGMVNALREQIENVMTTQGYNGRNETGYEGGVYLKLIELVKKFIAIEDGTELVKMDLESKIVDINWQRINLALFERLAEESYVQLSPEEMMLYVNLPESLHSIDSIALNSLIPNGHELAQCLAFFSEWTIEQKANLVMAYLKDKTSEDQEAILTTLDDQAPQLTVQLKTQSGLQRIYYTIAIQKGEIAAVKTHLEKGTDINAALGLLFSEDNKSDSLYWLHEHKEVVAKITADGMKTLIANGKYKGKTVAEVLVSSKKGRQLLLENPALQTLIPETIANRSKEDYVKQAASEKQNINTLVGFFKKQDPLATQLGQYIVYGDLEKAEKMLKENPTLVDKLLIEKVTVKDYSGRKLKGAAFQLTLGAMDNEMCEMLAKYMKKDDIARQYQDVFPEGHENYYAKQKSFDFSAIVDAISLGSNTDVEKALDLELPNTTVLWSKLEQFRTDFTKQSKTETVFNPQHLIKAFELYNQKFDSWNWEQRDLFWRQVIGYTQRFLPANIAMVLAYSLYDVVDNQAKAPRSFKFRYDDASIFPLLGVDDLSGLGYKFATRLGVEDGAGPTAEGGGRESRLYKTYVDQKLQTCRTYAATVTTTCASITNNLK